ncbi:DNA-binding transcriptional ArsR family regulator [Filibacter limicola]|uniref:DNA-binding transcriptional ArsR family regulator n=1 Tax=Sporosarcina limicola TaxID=34101 RepID=A0A927MKK4_9BACL|nr:DNA-binding transcriptional ArsR family regulator [Sporosarcina limicola]
MELEYSLLWESALGIAAVTNTPLVDTLEKQNEFEKYSAIMSSELRLELDYVEKNNTWKSLLQLLHSYESSSSDLGNFIGYINHLPEVELRYICLPYLGIDFQEKRKLTAEGDRDSIQFMMKKTEENSFFPGYINFISQVPIAELRTHLINVISLWHEVVIESQSSHVNAILKSDCDEKNSMIEKFTSEEFVSWVTGGIDYIPEPSVHTVLLIPQITYRPWTIVSDIEEMKVFYYPVADGNIHPTDTYLPSTILIQKYKALGDEVRLRIIKLLSERDHSLKEITETLELGKSTAHHHLKILRTATLVEIKNSKYRLKERSINWLSRELDFYLKK